jgi:hypothetical protein
MRKPPYKLIEIPNTIPIQPITEAIYSQLVVRPWLAMTTVDLQPFQVFYSKITIQTSLL